MAFVVTRLFCTNCVRISAVGVIPSPSSGIGCICAATGGTSAPIDPGEPAASIASVLKISIVNTNSLILLLQLLTLRLHRILCIRLTFLRIQVQL